VGQGTWGATTINLRGLGPAATLVLINGRRVVPTAAVSPSGAGVGSVVDTDQIPVSAIERIEILRGGASAIYGADAVAGVVNVITRRDYSGMRVDASAQSSDKFDYSQYATSVTLGANAEKARANVSISYQRQTRLGTEDRDFTMGHTTQIIGYPASFANDIMALPDPACEKDPRGKLAKDATGTLCNVDAQGYGNLSDPRDRVSGLGYAEYDITNHTYAFAELGVGTMRNQTDVPPSFPALQTTYVPADHRDNPFDTRFSRTTRRSEPRLAWPAISKQPQKIPLRKAGSGS
jgi:outer membrane receptor protein involved in Fe transport